MSEEYVVHGRYLARYPNGYYSGEVGISTRVEADDIEVAKASAAAKAKAFYGYTDFRWITVQVEQLGTSEKKQQVSA